MSNFFEKNLKPINFDKIEWDDGQGNFNETAKNSQLLYFLKKYQITKKVCVVHHACFDETVIDNSEIDFLLVNCSDHPYNLPVYSISKPSLIIDSDFNKPNYWPYHLLFSAYLSLTDHVDLQSEKTYYLSCVNRSPRVSRIYIRVKLDNFINDKCKFIWYRATASNGPIINDQLLIDSIGFENFCQYKKIDSASPLYQPRTEYKLCSSIEDYKDSYLNLVTESRLEDIGFLTEKTFKPIRAGQLFLIQGPPGTIGFLRKLGFDTFDDYIDHSYDTIDDWVKRTDTIHDELKKLFPDIRQIYLDTEKRRQENIKILKSFINKNVWTEHIAEKINANI